MDLIHGGTKFRLSYYYDLNTNESKWVLFNDKRKGSIGKLIFQIRHQKFYAPHAATAFDQLSQHAQGRAPFAPEIMRRSGKEKVAWRTDGLLRRAVAPKRGSRAPASATM